MTWRNNIIMQVKYPRAVIIGNSGVGKTSLIHRISYGSYLEQNHPTIGVGISNIKTQLNDKPFEYQLWDTAGQEIFRSVVPLYLRDSNCIILVFSLSDENSFEDMEEWLNTIRNINIKNVPIVIAANKSDLNDWKVDIYKAKDWAYLKKIPLFITSSITGQNIDNLFEMVAGNCFASLKEDFVINDDKNSVYEEKAKNCC